jgi:hypothetical protein
MRPWPSLDVAAMALHPPTETTAARPSTPRVRPSRDRVDGGPAQPTSGMIASGRPHSSVWNDSIEINTFCGRRALDPMRPKLGLPGVSARQIVRWIEWLRPLRPKFLYDKTNIIDM